jgi:hypothetical protein
VRWRFLLLLGIAGLASCHQVSTEEAQGLVERYNQAVSEAYRRGDVRLTESVVGPSESKKLAGLIGVRLDMGITLDAKLLALEITGVEQSKDELQVRTTERWHYRDLKIGSGEQIGEESEDAYEMLYVFTKIDRAWVVDEIRFTAPAEIGRKTMLWGADRRVLHSVAEPTAAKGSEVP